MHRREFSACLVAAGLGWTGLAQAQGTPVEGQHYVKLNQPLPVTPGKIEVIEFFWYGCPHCNAFEPALDDWAKKLPADVAFRRVPVAFRDEPFTAHQKIFYALEAMGLIPTLHRKVFYAIHVERQRLDKLPDISAFMVKNGVDAAKFTENFNSFSTQTKVRQAAKLAADYKIDGVPAIGVQGKYFTSGTLAGSPESSLAVANWLIQRERKPG
ncbi:thiol:disulfide interchange protein DsbA/DsbL [Piscinibacter sp. XHJ-5]|uniref:thiol:disulfide interchange protein DsbA/DsbL n=1 Tax=Piscinibacter sp. XHJ-5 TaxID=3037797 RepID=UPI00245358C1|nr:thiol:disulfide interchange protein DsbA/DsbL [Piscinibacter sp. XHJ-5]